MDAGLLNVVRGRMENQSSDELLRMWVTNDQDQWSPEAFEAARLILIERGVDIPPQNEPIKDVPEVKHSPDEYWLRWLKVILIMGTVVAGADLLVGITGVRISMGDPYDSLNLAWKAGLFPFIQEVLNFYGMNVGVPLILIFGIIQCWRLKPSGRIAMMVYAWTAGGYAGWSLAVALWWLLRRASVWQAHEISRVVHTMVYPAILLLFMTRPQIKQLFAPTRRGFDPTFALAGPSPTPPP